MGRRGYWRRKRIKGHTRPGKATSQAEPGTSVLETGSDAGGHKLDRATIEVDDFGRASAWQLGTASVTVEPDEIRVLFDVECFGHTAAERDVRATSAREHTLQLLDGYGIAFAARWISDLKTYPDEESTLLGQNGEGFASRQRIACIVSNQHLAEALLDAETPHSGPITIRGSIRYAISPQNPARVQAMINAIEGARAAIEAAASEKGFTTGPLMTISDARPEMRVIHHPPQFELPRRASVDVLTADARQPRTAPAGIEIDVSARCEVQYRLLDRAGQSWPILAAPPVAVVHLSASRSPGRWRAGDRPDATLYSEIAAIAQDQIALFAEATGTTPGRFSSIRPSFRGTWGPGNGLRIERYLDSDAAWTHVASEAKGSVTVVGSGSVDVTPDRVQAAFYITSRHRTKEDAAAGVAAAFGRIEGLLDRWSIPRDGRTTKPTQVHVTSWEDALGACGFVATTEVRFPWREQSLEELELLAGGILSESGSLRDPESQETQIDLVFLESLRHDHPARREAFNLATESALADATSLAAAFGCKIGWPIRTTDISQEGAWDTFTATDLTGELVIERHHPVDHVSRSCGRLSGEPVEPVVDYEDSDPLARSCRAEVEVEFSLL